MRKQISRASCRQEGTGYRQITMRKQLSGAGARFRHRAFQAATAPETRTGKPRAERSIAVRGSVIAADNLGGMRVVRAVLQSQRHACRHDHHRRGHHPRLLDSALLLGAGTGRLGAAHPARNARLRDRAGDAGRDRSDRAERGSIPSGIPGTIAKASIPSRMSSAEAAGSRPQKNRGIQ